MSHTKLDIDKEPRVTDAIIRYLGHHQPVRAWVDSGDIDAGSQFSAEIEEGVDDSSLLCVLTDNYSSREWCRREVLLAKRLQRPVAVVAAFNRQEVRSFPYLGNLPVLRWPCIPPDVGEDETARINREAAAAAVDLLLKESLRHLYATTQLQRAALADDFVSARPPELLSLVFAGKVNSVLYPDPPLGREELELLSVAEITATTPLSRLAAEKPLKGRKVALSMSESTEIERFGFDELHFREAMVDLSRYLLLKGATLVYGGHLGEEGYTRLLFDLVLAHHDVEGMKPPERIVNTVGWPLPYNQRMVADFSRVARLQRIERPDDLDACPGKEIADRVEAEPFDKQQSPEMRYCWARGLTTMREAQVEEGMGIAARIIMGGKFGPPESGPGADESWYSGRMPGVLEEVVLSVQAGQPVFLIGAYGGAARLAIDLIEGVDRTEATWAYQRRAPHAEAMRALYDQCGQTWLDYPEIVQLLRAKGAASINPLLSADQNRELFYTRSISRILELILTGLDNLSPEN